MLYHFGVLEAHAEDDGIGEAVAAFQELGDFPSHNLAAFLDEDVLVKVGTIVDLVVDMFAMLVLEARRWTPAFGMASRAARQWRIPSGRPLYTGTCEVCP